MADDPEVPTPNELDIQFDQESENRLYRTSVFKSVNAEARRDRITNEIRFEDIVAELTSHSPGSGGKISCPFHGRDSTPSYQVYSDHGFCFGCPPGEQYFNHDRFVAKYLGISRIKALSWIEKKWGLPPLKDTPLDEGEAEDDVIVQLSFDDLVGHFLRKAEVDIQKVQEADLAAEYQAIYFDALYLMEQAKAARIEHDDAEEGAAEAKQLESKAAITLAKVIGKKTIKRLLKNKY